MPKAGEINIFLNAISSGFSTGLGKAQKELANFTKGFADINGAIRTVVDGLSMASAVAAYFGDQLQRLDDMADMSQRLNISSLSIQEFQRALQLTGGEVEGLSASLAILQRNIGKAAMGTGKGAAHAIEQLGLDAEKLANIGLDEAFRKIVAEISKLPTPAERAAIASELFGKSASNLTGLLSDQGQAMRKAGQEVRQYGIDVNAAAKEIDAAVKARERSEMAKSKAESQYAIASAPYLEKFYGGKEFLYAGLAEIEFGKMFSDPLAFLESYAFMFRRAEDRYQASRFDPARSVANIPPPVDNSQFNDPAFIERWLKEVDRDIYGLPRKQLEYDYFNFDQVWASMRPRLGPAGSSAFGRLGLPSQLANMIGLQAQQPSGMFSGGAGAMEFGTAAAFSAIQQSQRQDESKRIMRQQLEEAKETNKNLKEIIDTGFLAIEVANLQG